MTSAEECGGCAAEHGWVVLCCTVLGLSFGLICGLDSKDFQLLVALSLALVVACCDVLDGCKLVWSSFENLKGEERFGSLVRSECRPSATWHSTFCIMARA